MKMTRITALLGVAMLVAALGVAQAANMSRDALIKLADDYVAALAAHAPNKAPLASDVKMVENAKRIKPGEGLWKTTTAGPTDFRIVVPDTVSQEVGGMYMIKSDNKPTMYGFRLKVVNNKIVEAEHITAEISGASLANVEKLRPAINMEVPYEYRDSRGRLLHIAKSYYDALDLNNGGLAPFAADCERHENGMRTAPFGGPSLGGAGIPGQAPPPPSLQGMLDCKEQLDSQTFLYITSIDNRRVEIADELTGLVVGFSHFRHAMTEKTYKILNNPARETTTMDFAPFDLPAMHIYKIWGGNIHEIEAMGFTAPFNIPTGWE